MDKGFVLRIETLTSNSWSQLNGLYKAIDSASGTGAAICRVGSQGGKMDTAWTTGACGDPLDPSRTDWYPSTAWWWKNHPHPVELSCSEPLQVGNSWQSYLECRDAGNGQDT